MFNSYAFRAWRPAADGRGGGEACNDWRDIPLGESLIKMRSDPPTNKTTMRSCFQPLNPVQHERGWEEKDPVNSNVIPTVSSFTPTPHPHTPTFCGAL